MATADHDRQRQAAHRRYKLRTVVEFASGSQLGADSARDFSVGSLSPTVCVAVVATLTGEMTAICQHV